MRYAIDGSQPAVQVFYMDEAEGHSGIRLWRCTMCKHGWTPTGGRLEHEAGCLGVELDRVLLVFGAFRPAESGGLEF